MESVIGWFVAHKVGLILGWLCTSLVNAMSAYPGPDSHALSQGLHWVLDAVSFFAKSNVQQGLLGFIKIPFWHRARQAMVPKAPASPVSVATGNAVKS